MKSPYASSGLVALMLFVFPIAAQAQCKGGGKQGGSSMRGQAGAPPMGGMSMRVQCGSPQMGGTSMSTQGMGRMGGPNLNTAAPGLPNVNRPTLQTATTRQQQLIGLITSLSKAQDSPALRTAQQRKLQNALATAMKKVEKQDEWLTGLQDRERSALWNVTQQQRLHALLEQQAALLTALEQYQAAVAQAMDARELQAKAAR